MLSREVKERLREYETPFYLYDMELLRRTVECALREADRYGYRLHYAMKANNDRRIMEFIASCGMGADCVSGNEVRRAIETGFAPKDIVYAGVGKKDSEIIYALRQGIFAFNCESKNELVVIDALARELGVVADVALRINPDIDPHTHSYITTGLSENKFGISPREITDVVGMLGDLRNIDIMGLHFHIGSQITDLGVFAELCRKVNASYRWFTEEGFRITDVNVGGGLGVDYDVPEMHPVPDFAAYFAVFAQGLDLPASVGVHFEPRTLARGTMRRTHLHGTLYEGERSGGRHRPDRCEHDRTPPAGPLPLPPCDREPDRYGAGACLYDRGNGVRVIGYLRPRPLPARTQARRPAFDKDGRKLTVPQWPRATICTTCRRRSSATSCDPSAVAVRRGVSCREAPLRMSRWGKKEEKSAGKTFSDEVLLRRK